MSRPTAGAEPWTDLRREGVARLLHVAACPRSEEVYEHCIHRPVHEHDAGKRGDAIVDLLAASIRRMGDRGPFDDSRIQGRDLMTSDGPNARPYEWAETILSAIVRGWRR